MTLQKPLVRFFQLPTFVSGICVGLCAGICSSMLAWAEPATSPQPAYQVTVYRDGKQVSAFKVENHSIQNQKVLTVRSKLPHPNLNPEGKTETFEGASLKDLLRLQPSDDKKEVYFVGVDGYVSPVPASVLRKTDAILALKREGQPISEVNGGLQVVYPTEGKNAAPSDVARIAHYWCWYVRNIAIGELPAQFKKK